MDSNTNNKISLIKSHLENMKLQIDNIEMQNNSNIMLNPSIIGEQILNISIQMFNAGIQAFNTGINDFLIMNTKKFYEQLVLISNQINSIINGYNMEQEQTMMMMPPLIPPPIIPQSNMFEDFEQDEEPEQTNITMINIIFADSTRKDIVISRKVGITIKELLDNYFEQVYENYGDEIDNCTFLYNARKLDRYDNRKIEKVFRGDIAKIYVVH